LIDPFEIPAAPGTYGLLMRLAEQKRITIGHLGEFHFLPGDYVYVGSAFGSGGLRGRLGRHLRAEKKMHWHLDWFLMHAEVRGYFFQADGEHHECFWIRSMKTVQKASLPAPGFGSSDCRQECGAHLVYFGCVVDLIELCNRLYSHSQKTMSIFPVKWKELR
jgi:Uri superfamily endonuclease